MMQINKRYIQGLNSNKFEAILAHNFAERCIDFRTFVLSKYRIGNHYHTSEQHLYLQNSKKA